MSLSPRLDLRQAQTLVMTPQLQQAIKLLQMSNVELSSFIEQELERNPMLEREDAEHELASENEGETRADAVADNLIDPHVPGESEAPLDIDCENVWNHDSPSDGDSQDWGNKGGRADFEDSEYNLENTLSREPSLREHLEDQINLDMVNPTERLIALNLMDLLNEAGWFIGDIAEVAERLEISESLIEAVLLKLQKLDPPGIFARSLKECLALQLIEKDRFDPAMEALVNNLELLAKRDMAGLLKVCAVDSEDLSQMISELRALDPKPALKFEHEIAETMVPDVLMRRLSDGSFAVELNPDTLPRVLVNVRYYQQVNETTKNKEERQFINERMQTANWLVKSLHQRATTIMKVATEIVRSQEMFFLKGIQYLRPMVLKDIAQIIGMHESTVSRVTANKYIATPRGIFELKYFFTQALANNDGGEAHSAEAVRHRIKELIDAELPKSPLSDDQLVEVLRKEGIDIARRTVAKYREGLKIPSSVQRRREAGMK